MPDRAPPPAKTASRSVAEEPLTPASPRAPGDGRATARPPARSEATPDPGERRWPDARPDGETPEQTAALAREHEHEQPVHPGVPLAPPGIAPESDPRVGSPGSSKPQPAHGVVEELGELPWMYGDGRVVCLIRDPATVYVYWDFSQHQLEQAFNGLESARAVLRLLNAPKGGDVVRESEVHLEARGWYVRELPAGAELRAELWAVGANGQRLIRAARPVRLPPAAPSNVLEALYATVDPNAPLPPGGIGANRPLAWRSDQDKGVWDRGGLERFGADARTSSRWPWAPNAPSSNELGSSNWTSSWPGGGTGGGGKGGSER
jgi:hypothetical protein